jgi:hypothetical protein
VRPYRSAARRLVIRTAAAPSLSGQLLPAVTVPSSLNGVGSSPSRSTVVPGRGPSSADTTVPSSSVTGVISRANTPADWAATARSCDSLANASMSDRATPNREATFSAVIPMGR